MFLLDTNHCSRILDGDPIVLAHLRANSAVPVSTSVVTQGELVFMVERSTQRANNILRVSALLAGIRIYQIDPHLWKSQGCPLYQVWPKGASKAETNDAHTTGLW